MNYLVLDFEMCMVKGNAKKKMRGEKHEIIQIGAVIVDEKYHIIDEFSSYVKPEYGTIDTFIEGLTRISQKDVEPAPILRTVLMRFAEWIGTRKVTVLSWSDSDYHQLKNEMKIKKIKNYKIEDLLDKWIDFQRSFDTMLGISNQYALEDAMKISRLKTIGQMHDGLSDAYNTARLFIKIHRQSAFKLKLDPITSYSDRKAHLCFSLSELFTPELMAQIHENAPETVVEPVDEKHTNWSIWRKMYRFFKGQTAAEDENWNKVLFTNEMKKIEITDWLGGIIR